MTELKKLADRFLQYLPTQIPHHTLKLQGSLETKIPFHLAFVLQRCKMGVVELGRTTRVRCTTPTDFSIGYIYVLGPGSIRSEHAQLTEIDTRRYLVRSELAVFGLCGGKTKRQPQLLGAWDRDARSEALLPSDGDQIWRASSLFGGYINVTKGTPDDPCTILKFCLPSPGIPMKSIHNYYTSRHTILSCTQYSLFKPLHQHIRIQNYQYRPTVSTTKHHRKS